MVSDEEFEQKKRIKHKKITEMTISSGWIFLLLYLLLSFNETCFIEMMSFPFYDTLKPMVGVLFIISLTFGYVWKILDNYE